jgi:hypothetical protein
MTTSSMAKGTAPRCVPTQFTRFRTRHVALLVTAWLLTCAGVGRGATSSAKEIHLNGVQDGFYEKAEYAVDSVVTVERGKAMRFAPGCVVRLARYAEVRVRGKLECLGTPLENVQFSSRTPGTAGLAEKAAPFGWNGVVVDDSAAVLNMENTRISCSTFGIKVASEHASVTLKDVCFTNNGSSNLVVAGTPVNAPEDAAFSFVYPPVRGQQVAPLTSSTQAAGADSTAPARKTRVAVVRKKPESWRMPVQVSLGGLTLAGAALGVGGEGMGKRDQRQNEQGTSGGDFASMRKRRDSAILVRNIGIPCLLVGAANLTLTFFF